jgi:hypothetical protein
MIGQYLPSIEYVALSITNAAGELLETASPVNIDAASANLEIGSMVCPPGTA